MKELKIKDIDVMFTSILTTANKYTKEEVGVEVLKEGSLKEYQTVLKVGPNVRHVKVGQTIMINPDRYAVKEYVKNSIKNDIEGYNKVLRYNFNTLEIDGKDTLLLDETDTKYILIDFEEVEVKDSIPGLILPEQKIIIN